MNCCGGTEHKHGESGQSNGKHEHNGTSPNWLPTAALLLIAVLVSGLLFALLK